MKEEEEGEDENINEHSMISNWFIWKHSYKNENQGINFYQGQYDIF